MLIGLVVNVVISYLFKRLFESGRLDAKYDRWNAVVNIRSQTVKYRTDSDQMYNIEGVDNRAMEKECRMWQSSC